MHRPRTLILSPYAGDTTRNVAYAQAAMIDSIRRGEAPFLSHLLYTQVLDDTVGVERCLGFELEWSWAQMTEHVASYEDYGASPGMHQTAARLQNYSNQNFGPPYIFEVRKLGAPWS